MLYRNSLIRLHGMILGVTILPVTLCVYVIMSPYKVVGSCHPITNQPTNSMEQSPSWEADSHSASQEAPQLFLLDPEDSSSCS